MVSKILVALVGGVGAVGIYSGSTGYISSAALITDCLYGGCRASDIVVSRFWIYYLHSRILYCFQLVFTSLGDKETRTGTACLTTDRILALYAWIRLSSVTT